MTFFLVRHGRPLAAPGAADPELDPAGFDDVWALRESGRLPSGASWFCAPEPVVTATAQLLTEQDVGVLAELRLRDAAESEAAYADRLVGGVRRVLDVHGREHVVLVGHGSAWTLVVAALTGAAPEPDRWRSSGVPDLLILPEDV